MRVFLALRLPLPVLNLAAEMQTCATRRLPRSTRVSPVALDTNGHVTLVFLGEVGTGVVADLKSHVTDALQKLALDSAPILRAKRAINTWGNGPLVVHIPVEYDDALGRVQDVLRVAAGAVHPPAGRSRGSFQAHITLARVHSDTKIWEARRAIRDANQALENVETDPGDKEVGFAAVEVVLFESKNDDSGRPLYVQVWSVPVL